MRVAVLAPIQNSLYSRVMTHLLHLEDGVEVACVCVRTPWNLKRMRGEIKRDGARLVRKAYQKLVVGEKGLDPTSDEHLLAVAKKHGMPGKNLTELCRHHGIKLVCTKDHNAPDVVAAMTEKPVDVVAFTGGGLIRQNILDLPRLGVLNCHMGPLPAYRGMDVIEYPVLERGGGEPTLGLTVHYMAKGVDTGDLLMEQRFDLREDDTYAGIRVRVPPMMADLMMRTVRGLRDGTIQPRPQQARDGKQYYVMHPRVYEKAQRELERYQRGMV